MEGPIVVGTDGSETATKAVVEAIALAKAFGQPLHVVSAYKPLPSNVSVPSEFSDSVKPDSNVRSVLEAAAARARVAGVDVEEHAETGDPADVILDLADQLNAGCIVIGNKGIGSARRYILGNVPSKVVHHAPCSTFVIHTT